MALPVPPEQSTAALTILDFWQAIEALSPAAPPTPEPLPYPPMPAPAVVAPVWKPPNIVPPAEIDPIPPRPMSECAEALRRVNGAAPDKPGKRDMQGLAAALAVLGYGVEPDPAFGGRSPRPDEALVLFRNGGSEAPDGRRPRPCPTPTVTRCCG